MAKKQSNEGGSGDAGAASAKAAPPLAAGSGYVVLARKYRPATFDDLIGQDAMVRTLRNAFTADRIAQGYMLTGVRGVGKTTTARILARALNYSVPGQPDRPTVDMPVLGVHCKDILASQHPDVMEMDAASHTGVDNIREVIEIARQKPMLGRYRVFIIDEVHMLSKGAFNALLKTLEEPPPHVKFIFATTEIRKVPVTVLSRCQRFDLRRVDVPVLAEHFQRVVDKEGAKAEDEALALIARAAEGSVRDGLSILDQAIATSAAGAREVSAADVRAMLGLADRGRLFDLIEHLFAGRAGAALDAFQSLYRDGADPIEALVDLAEAVHLATRIKIAGAAAAGLELSEEERRRGTALAGAASIGVLSRAWQMLIKGIDEAGRAPSAHTAGEMVLIRIAHAADLPSPEDIIGRLGGGEFAARAASPGVPSASRSERQPLNAAPDAGPAFRGGAGDEPPPASLDDYGAFDPTGAPPPELEDDGEGAEGAEDDVVAAPRLDNPRTFAEVVALAGKRRDAKLKLDLEDNTSLVKFDPAGAIEIHLLANAPTEMANELREKLNRWTGRRWVVAVSHKRGERPLGEIRREQEAAELEALKSHPAVSAVLQAFPDARITSVKPVTARLDDDQAAG
jgi:DNA polymerase-3 subunit gamma/tau